LIDVRVSPRSLRFSGLQVAGWLAVFVVAIFAVNNGALWQIHGALGRFLNHLVYHEKVTRTIILIDILFGISFVYLLASAISDWLQ
jgi:hypothetical protein